MQMEVKFSKAKDVNIVRRCCVRVGFTRSMAENCRIKEEEKKGKGASAVA